MWEEEEREQKQQWESDDNSLGERAGDTRQSNFSHVDCLKLTIFGGENNDNIYSSEVVKKTKNTVLIHIASRRQIRQLFTLNNKECGVSFKKYFGDADEDFYEISCSGKVNLRNINNGQKILLDALWMRQKIF